MTEADSVHSTPPLNSSASNIIDLDAARTAATPKIAQAIAAEITLHSRPAGSKPRRSST
jgi:hypothetical protein